MSTVAFASLFVPGSTTLGSKSLPQVALRPSRQYAQPSVRRQLVAVAEPGLVGIGVIGCGRIGKVHSRAITNLTDAELVMVADPFEKFGRELEEELGTVWVPDWQDMLVQDNIKGVVIGSPTPFHAEQIIKCAEAGKDIFCEKPISNDLATIDNCLAAVKANNVRLLVGFQRRFDSNFLKVQREIEKGTIGEVRTFTIISRDPAPPPAEYLAKSGGIFLDMASHDFDMARFVTGSEIEEVYVTGKAFEPAAQEANDLDTVITVLKMKNGAFGTIENSRRCSYGYDQRIEVFGSKGSIISNNKNPDTVLVNNQKGSTAGQPYSFFMDRYADAYSNIMSAFVRMIKTNSPSPVTGLDGRAPIVAGLAAAKSVAEGRAVRLEECERVLQMN